MAETDCGTLVACCGLFCGTCDAFKKGCCGGCSKNEKAGWCAVRKCCHARGFPNCAACADFQDYAACKKLNGAVSRIIGFFSGSSRLAGVRRIRQVGAAAYAAEMLASGKRCPGK